MAKKTKREDVLKGNKARKEKNERDADDDLPKHWSQDPAKLSKWVDDKIGKHGYRFNLDAAVNRLYYERPLNLDGRVRQARDVDLDDVFAGFGANITREVVDADIAQVCKDMRPRFVTTDADEGLLRSVKGLERLNDAALKANDFRTEALKVAKDCRLDTIGGVKSFIDVRTKELKIERFDPRWLLWDFSEGSRPMSFALHYSIPKRRLCSTFGDPNTEEGRAIIDHIMRAPTYVDPPVVGADLVSSRGGSESPDNCRLDEGWSMHLGDDYPGVHAYVVNGMVLGEVEPWPFENFVPLSFLRWDWERTGFGGISLGSIVAPCHIRYRKWDQLDYDVTHGAIPVTFVHEDEESFRGIPSDPFGVAKYSHSSPPKREVASPRSQDLVAAKQEARQDAYRSTGTNQDLATGQLPAKFESAPAQNAWVDNMSERQLRSYAMWEQFYADVSNANARLMVIAYKDRKTAVKAPGTEMMDDIDWSKLDMNEEAWRVSVSMTSGLSKSPSARMDQASQLLDRQVIDNEDYASIVGGLIPDVPGISERAGAAGNLADYLVSLAADEGTLQTPPATAGEEVLVRVAKYGRAKYLRLLAVPPPSRPKNYRKVVNAVRTLYRIAEELLARSKPADPEPAPQAMAGSPEMTSEGLGQPPV